MPADSGKICRILALRSPEPFPTPSTIRCRSQPGDRIRSTEHEAALRRAPDSHFPIDQRIDLREGQNYLYLAVWDMVSGRLGTLQIPFRAAKPSKAGK